MIRHSKSRLLAWLLIVILPSASARADVITIGSQAGAQIFFNNTLTRTYNFGVTQSGAGLTVTQLDVNVKGNTTQSTLSPVIVSLYNGLGGTGSVLGSGTIAASSLSVQFDFISVPFSTLTLPAGGYSVVLSTTNTADYYIKAGTTKLTTNGTTAVTSSQWVEDTNTDGNAGTTLTASGTVLAQYALGTNAFAFGNYRVGTTLSTTTTLVNTALLTSNTVTQALAATGATTGGVNSLTGLPSPYLSAGGTSNVVAGLNGATTGPNSGTATLTFNSVPGTSNTSGTTAVGSGTLALSGTGYNWANAVYSGTAFNFGFVHRSGAASSGTVAIGNQTVTNASYQDLLNVSASTGNSLVAASGFTGLLASAGGTTRNNLVVSIGTGTAGSLNSTLALSLVSNANNVAGLSNGTATTVGSPGSITTTGTVYSGQSVWATNGGGQWGTLSSSFGTNWETYNGSPGLDAGFTDTDTATFGGVLTGGTATVTITAATPSVKSLTFANAAASYVLAGASGGSLALLNTGTNAAAVAVTSGSHTISSAIALGSNAAIDAAAGSRLSIDGIVSGSQNLRKTGGGTVVLSGSNTYAGTTTVAGGRLLIHGNQTTATGAITVENGGTLGGRGAAGGAVTVLAGGTLSPGASVESLSVGATTFSGSSTFFYEVDSSAALSAAADLLTVNGNLSIASGSLIDFTDLASSPSAFADGTKFTLISYGSNSWDGGFFTYGTNQLTNGEVFSAGLNNWQIKYNDTTGGSNFTADQLSGSSVTITTIVVPEPASLALLAVGLLTLGGIGCRRRRRIAGIESSR